MPDLDTRNKIRYCAHNLGDCETVLGTDVIPPQTEGCETWMLEIVLSTPTASPAVLRELSLAGLDLLPDASGTQGDPPRAIVIATT